MGVRNIVVNDLELLHEKSRPITEFDEKLSILLDDMVDTINNTDDGVGLAAPQIGVLRCVVVINTGKKIIELVNPKILEQNGEQVEYEGCLSFPGRFEKIKRPSFVRVEYFSRTGEKLIIEGKKLLARALCHEIDHLNGIVFLDRLGNN